MNKAWTFVGGMLAGVVSVFAAAAVAVELDSQKCGNASAGGGEEEQLALPEGSAASQTE